MRIGVIGTGYVGLVVGACLAETGHDVVCVDTDEGKIEGLREGRLPIYEPGLEPLVRQNAEAGRLSFSTDVAAAVRDSLVLFIAVGTPAGLDGAADLGYVLEVASAIGRAANGEKIVITKSTVPVGTARRVAEVIRGETDHLIHVCSNPEFLKEGAAVSDFMKPDRVVLGVDSERASEVLTELYAPFVRSGRQVVLMDVASAEITKYAANAMLATRISFMNQIARLCEVAGADVEQVRLGIGSDTRIGPSFLFAGIGYGGSCFPKDVRALARTCRDLGVDSALFDAVEEINHGQKHLILERVLEHFGSDLSERTFAVWGLAFKPGTDDLREAPSLVSIAGITQRGGRIVAHDPVAMEAARSEVPDEVEFANSNYDALDEADALLIHTEWNPYRQPDFTEMRRRMKGNLIFDGRNLYEPDRMAAAGFDYRAVGRSNPQNEGPQ